MAIRSFGTVSRRPNPWRVTITLALLGTTALVAIPEVEAAGEIVTEFPAAPGPVWRIPALSADGSMWVGAAGASVYFFGPDGAIDIGGLGSLDYVYGLNGRGTVAVGASSIAGNWFRAFRWTAAGGSQDLGVLFPGNGHSYAYDVSGDGTRVVGVYERPGMSRAFVWIEGATGGENNNPQMYRLDGLDDAGLWSAAAISDDGNYAVGYSDGNATLSLATRWDLRMVGVNGTNSVISLGSFTDPESGASRATDVSADGRVVVGSAVDSDGITTAFRWVEGSTTGVVDNVQMHDLGALGDDFVNESLARAVSRDGQYVVGWSDTNVGHQLAFRWSEATGMESIADWLGRNGVSVGELKLIDATAISDNGLVVAGIMVMPDDDERAYIARVAAGPGPGPGPGGVMDVAEYQQSLFSTTQIAHAGEFLTWLPMNGAHHRPLMQSPSLSGDTCVWATGDFASHGGTKTGLGLAEAGACVDLAGGNLRLGGAVGASRSWQDLALGGSSRLSGQYVLGEVDWQPDGTPLLLSVTGMLGGWQADIHRGYSNGGATAYSDGTTNVTGGVVRVRADWLEAATIGNTTINPWASVAFGQLHINGFTESGGPFPASFAAQTLGSTDIRLGVTAETALSSQTTLSTTFEVAHRGGTAPAAAGTVIGLFDFNLGGGQYGQTWVRVGAELDHQINDNLALSGSLHLATNGRDPSVSGSIGLKAAF